MIHYLSRSDWDNTGLERWGYQVDPRQFVGLAVHHTVTSFDPGTGVGGVVAHMKRLQQERPDLGLDVPYSWVVFPHEDPSSSYVAEGRGSGRTGAHTSGYNSTRYGVACVGNYVFEFPTSGLIEGIKYVGRTFDPWASMATLGHQDFPNNATACPGSNLESFINQLQPPFSATDFGEEMTREELNEALAPIYNALGTINHNVDLTMKQMDSFVHADPSSQPNYAEPVVRQGQGINDGVATIRDHLLPEVLAKLDEIIAAQFPGS